MYGPNPARPVYIFLEPSPARPDYEILGPEPGPARPKIIFFLKKCILIHKKMNNTFKMYINLSYLIIIQYYLYKKINTISHLLIIIKILSKIYPKY